MRIELGDCVGLSLQINPFKGKDARELCRVDLHRRHFLPCLPLKHIVMYARSTVMREDDRVEARGVGREVDRLLEVK